MGWLSGPSETKAAAGADGLAPTLSLGPGAALYPASGFLSAANHGFGRNELVYACIMELATSMPEATLRVYGPDGLGEPKENHPLRALLADPNPILSEFELFELTVIHLYLAGTAFWEVVRDQAGRPVQLWPLRPDLVRFWLQPNGQVRYGFWTTAGTVDLGTDVIAFRLPNPIDPLVGQPPLRPALRAVALDNEATDFVKALLQNRAVPGTVITVQQKLDEGVADRLVTKWKQKFGGGRRGEPAVLQQGMDVKVLGLDLEKLEFPDLRTIAEARICSVFGVPPILVGAKVGLDRSTFANYKEARASFWEETIFPLQRRFRDVIVRALLPVINDATYSTPRRVAVRWDRSEVLALKESEQAIWERANSALRAGAITVNDFRRTIGMPLVDGGDVFLRPAGVVPTLADGTPTGGGILDPTPDTPDEEPEEEEDTAEEDGGTDVEGASLSDADLARMLAALPPG
ncbi:phage portal protein [Nocardiopsis tropica]|uniref:phage portal protein n=1 Tax=Nocardiopsis tropica TaxID=109330 RepID=UPI002E834025|nr:phage portal protein [Nocardiopsis tropica]